MRLEDVTDVGLEEFLDTDDVGQKRYLMHQVFELVLEEVYELNDEELPDTRDRVSELNGLDGYMYKMSQEFLTSSSTVEKERKLRSMVGHVKRKSRH